MVGSTVPCSSIAHSGQHTTGRRLTSQEYGSHGQRTGFSNGRPVACEIVYPSLSAGEAIVPVIIDIKTSNSGYPFDIYRAFRATSDRLLERAAFLFSDFERRQEAIATAAGGGSGFHDPLPRIHVRTLGTDKSKEGHPPTLSTPLPVILLTPPVVTRLIYPSRPCPTHLFSSEHVS